jgi:hypothetical protein
MQRSPIDPGQKLGEVLTHVEPVPPEAGARPG